jgi:hypothetical protein
MMTTVTFFDDFAAGAKRQSSLTLDELAARIRSTSAPRKDQLPWLKLARFGNAKTDKGSLRHDRNLIAVSGIEADYDGGLVSFEEAVETAGKAGLLAVIYTSPSHTPERPRWRVLCPTSKELPPAQRAHLVGRLNGLYRGIFAAESWTLSQSYYFGSVDNNPAHRVEVIDGQTIDDLDELDEIRLGKPSTIGGNGKTNGEFKTGPVDEAALLEEIRTGASYHTAAMRLLGAWGQRGMAMLEAKSRLLAAFDDVFPPDRDVRWHARVAEIPRLLEYVWGKEAGQQDAKREEADARPPQFSDEALALRFAAKHADTARYVAAFNRWLLWDSTRWAFDTTMRAFDLARATCRVASAEIVDPKLVKLAASIASAKTVAAVVSLGRADRRLAATVEQWNADPWVLTTKEDDQ